MQALLIKHFILWSFSSGPWSSFQSDTRLYGNHLSWPLYISSWTSFFSQCNPQFLLGSYVFVFPFYKLEVFLIRSIIAAMILLFSHGDWTVICESGLGIPAAREILGRQSPKSLRQRGPGIKTGTCSTHPWLAPRMEGTSNSKVFVLLMGIIHLKLHKRCPDQTSKLLVQTDTDESSVQMT